MKTRNIIALTIASAFAAISANAELFTSANIFWTGANQQPLYSLSNLSTDQNTKTPPITADWSNWVLGKFNHTSAWTGFAYIEGNRTTTLKGIYWGDTENTANYDNILHIYNNASTSAHVTTFNITDGITLNNSTSLSDGNVVKIRRKQNSGSFNVSVGDINILKKGTIYLGTSSGTGEYLTQANLTGNVKVENSGILSISANSVTMASGKTVTLNSGTMTFLGGVNESSGSINFGWSDLNMGTNNISASGTSYFNYGTGWNAYGTGNVSLGNIVIDPAAYFELSLYTSGKREVGAISNTGQFVSGSMFYVKTNKETITATSYNASMQTVKLSAKLNITGDFFDSSNAAWSYIDLSDTDASLIVDGTFSTANGKGLKFGRGLGTGKVGTYSFGGITGESTGFITSDYVGGDRNTVGNSSFILTGSGLYETWSKITDMSYNETGSQGLNGSISITKNGTGTQYFRGQTWYRGTTTVNSGKLYIAADLKGRQESADAWGIGNVVLNGGRFGACSSSYEYGTLYANNLTMNGGWLEFNINDTDFDVIKLLDTNAASVIAAADAALMKFAFVIDYVEENAQYKIVEWDSSIGKLDFDTSKFESLIEGNADGLMAQFFYADDGSGLYVKFVQAVPEPATIATIFGALALAFAAYRRRK